MSGLYYPPQIICISSAYNHKAVCTTYFEAQRAPFQSSPAHKPILSFLSPIWLNDEATALSIEMVRTLIYDLSYGIPADEIRSYIVLHLDTASVPAQNALLKTLEEPPPNTQLFLTTHDPALLLPTILSRCTVVNNLAEEVVATHQQASNDDQKTEAATWDQIINAADYSALMKISESITDRAAALALIRSLIPLAYQQLKSTFALSDITTLQKLYEAQNQLERNCNVKLVLEHCFFGIRST